MDQLSRARFGERSVHPDSPGGEPSMTNRIQSRHTLEHRRPGASATARDTPLRDVVGGGLRAIDVARISGVSQSTLSRLWRERRWLEHVGGATLARLIAVSPEVDRYVRRSVEEERLSSVVQSINSAGVGLRDGAFALLLEGSSASAVITALAAAAEMMHSHFADASRMFAIGWNVNSNKVIDALFTNGNDGLFDDFDEFLTAAEKYVNSCPSFCDLAEVVGFGIVKHKMIRTGCIAPEAKPGRNHGDEIAFLERSQTIGQIFKEDDLSIVDRYRNRVASQHSLSVNEIWSHATYANDLTMEHQQIPRKLKLHSTAAMTMHDMETCNDAYVYYLLTVAIPLLVRTDPSFGGCRQSMLHAVTRTMEQRSTPAIQKAAKKLHNELSQAH
jgi:hypothetical protein